MRYYAALTTTTSRIRHHPASGLAHEQRIQTIIG